MDRLHKAELPTSNSDCEHCRSSAAVRSYQQIAAILTERQGRPISARRVMLLCGSAERKIVRALLAGPVTRGAGHTDFSSRR